MTILQHGVVMITIVKNNYETLENIKYNALKREQYIVGLDWCPIFVTCS